jgi:hypothetical protein
MEAPALSGRFVSINFALTGSMPPERLLLL